MKVSNDLAKKQEMIWPHSVTQKLREQLQRTKRAKVLLCRKIVRVKVGRKVIPTSVWTVERWRALTVLRYKRKGNVAKNKIWSAPGS